MTCIQPPKFLTLVLVLSGQRAGLKLAQTLPSIYSYVGANGAPCHGQLIGRVVEVAKYPSNKYEQSENISSRVGTPCSFATEALSIGQAGSALLVMKFYSIGQ